jgi:hypothetical protein
MTFPNAHSQIYRNAEGEVLGWSDKTSYEPEYCDTCGFNHSGDCPEEDPDEDNYTEQDVSFEAMITHQDYNEPPLDSGMDER